jgi:imidazole glycerol-phosphate synthase subunit HisH
VAMHGINFPSSIQKGNVYGFQFHPEKSSLQGLEVLKKVFS